MNRSITFIGLIALALIVSCKKKSATTGTDPRIPPAMEFKTGTLYVSKDTTVVKQDTLLIGVNVIKTEDNLTSFNGSAAFDGSSTTTTFFNHQMTTAEYSGYNVDVKYYVRNQTGSEKIILSVVDRDGNITQKTITVTVQ